MYVKYLMNRIKTTPSKLWNDWKSFRNFPGMEYRDVHNILPKSHMWKFPARGSVKYDKTFNSDYFKWDYKMPYRDSIYFIRRFFPDMSGETVAHHNIPISKEDVDEISQNHLTWKEYYYDKTQINKFPDHETLEDKHKYFEQQVQAMFESKETKKQLSPFTTNKSTIYDTYFPVTDAFGTDKNVDISDMDSKWLYTYFDNLQILYDYDESLKINNDYQLNVYVGRTKAWQVLPDHFGKEQVDKIQSAIGAPLQDQLDEWESESLNKKIPMPITNENLHKFRDEPDSYEILDHDYERILYERQKKQKFEQLRNTRYDELLQIYYKNNIVSH